MSTHDDVAKILGANSWAEMLNGLEAGSKIYVNGQKLKLAGNTWDEMRVQFDVVQVRRGMNFVIGCRSSFPTSDVESDLCFADMVNTYDDPAMPVACPRSVARHEKCMAESAKAMADFRNMRRQMATLVAAVAAAMFVVSIVLVAVPVVSLSSLIFSLWAGGAAWMQFGDLLKDETGKEPRWSIRSSVVAQYVPLNWFGTTKR